MGVTWAALSSVCWVRILNTLKWDILATDVAIYFDIKLRKLKLQTYQSISSAKVREKPPDNAENRENGVWREGKFPSLTENAAEMRTWTTFINREFKITTTATATGTSLNKRFNEQNNSCARAL